MWSRYLGLVRGTAAENCLEPFIAEVGIPYRAQYPVWRFILDFAWIGAKVAVEVDGESHRTPDGIEKDRKRTAWLESKGWIVVRCKNEEALADPEGTVQRLIDAAKSAGANF
jgi:very-short-patch-repair endonuclease